MSGSAALADEYKAGEFLGLDLSQAVLSPKRLGPETQFAPVRIEARTDRKPVKTERVVVSKAAAPQPLVKLMSRMSAPRNRAVQPAPSWHSAIPIHSTRRRATRASQTWPCQTGAVLAAGSGSAFVGWVERSDTHHASARGLMGIAALYPSYNSNPPHDSRASSTCHKIFGQFSGRADIELDIDPGHPPCSRRIVWIGLPSGAWVAKSHLEVAILS